MAARFWETTSLDQLSDAEWESLCDGCARCCLIKLEDEDTQTLYFTRVACRLLDQGTCRCRAYEQRHQLVPDCLNIRALAVEQYRWLPETCAYRCLAESRPLPEWHPLLTGDSRSTHSAGFGISGWCQSEDYVHPDELEQHIIHFFPSGHIE